ncbi:hypothetical protein PPSIR1_38956 [Plesiocystis pacifica SIR-1]|uniref:SCP2 domain-containing protein n=1 Tax=Plesiocystis pacifica SIR-1 TaxID=391625 RepID=A6GGE2_9BACT|nr:hypothetical protein [Plesiocystis pacifica]EDM75063.1 hypothetical protein PPSIR1_38956 [Plesiocystis pacifica SIR-1]
MDVKKIFEIMPSRYNGGAASKPTVYYFSVGDNKYTVKLGETCEVENGKTVDNANVILKTTDKIFLNMVLHGKLPGPIDIARGKIKTNDPGALQKLREWFDFSQ